MSDSPIPTVVPVCPNHGEPLEGIGFPTPRKGRGICPVSGWPFDFKVEIDEQEMVKDKDGNMVKKPVWNVEGDED